MTRPEGVISAVTDSAAFERDLAEAGFALRVEGRAALAVLVGSASDAERLLDAGTRGLVQRLARSRGFTHCALEVGARESRAR